MRVLVTAFEPYDAWRENSSWLALMEVLKNRSARPELITRRYPVDLQALRARLGEDLQRKPDAILHLGQAPGSASLKLEAVALNFAGCLDEQGQELPPLVESGPLAYRSQMPLARWSSKLRQAGIPSMVSYHAGTFLCNATLYLTHHWLECHGQSRPVGFVHLPLATAQVADSGRNLPSLPVETLAIAIALLLDDLQES